MSLSVNPPVDEISRLWDQFFVALDECMSTISPLFLGVILFLYIASIITKSQTIASIGLVYVFVFLILMFSFFFAIVPFILISNAISSIVSPGGKNPLRDLTRVGMLFALIGLGGVYLRYGAAVL